MFLLGGQPYVYTEQDWSAYPGVAQEAYDETRRAYIIYSLGLATGVVENGRKLSKEEVRYRAIEFALGLAALLPHIDTVRVLRRAVNALFILDLHNHAARFIHSLT